MVVPDTYGYLLFHPGRMAGFSVVQVAELEGLEPPTYGFGDRRSTN